MNVGATRYRIAPGAGCLIRELSPPASALLNRVVESSGSVCQSFATSGTVAKSPSAPRLRLTQLCLRGRPKPGSNVVVRLGGISVTVCIFRSFDRFRRSTVPRRFYRPVSCQHKCVLRISTYWSRLCCSSDSAETYGAEVDALHRNNPVLWPKRNFGLHRSLRRGIIAAEA